MRLSLYLLLVVIVFATTTVAQNVLYLSCGARSPHGEWRLDTHRYRSDNALSYSTTRKIAGSKGWEHVYQTHAYAAKGDLVYTIPVVKGRDYKVDLLFSETFHRIKVGMRLFSVSVNGKIINESLDVLARTKRRYRPLFIAAGWHKATYGVIEIRLAHIRYANNPMISAIVLTGRNVAARVGDEGRVAVPIPALRGPSCSTAQRVTGRVSNGFVMNAGGPAIQRLGVGAENLNYIHGWRGEVARGNSRVKVATIQRRPYYATQRFTTAAALVYRIPVARWRRYTVRLLFAETHFNAAKRRMFSIRINGIVMARYVDVYAQVGKNVEYIRDFPNIRPYQGFIVISLEKIIDNPFINAVRIIGRGANSVAIAGFENGRCVPAISPAPAVTTAPRIVSAPKPPPSTAPQPATTAPVVAPAAVPRRTTTRVACKVAERVLGRVKAGFFMTMGGEAIPRLGIGAENLNYIIGDRGAPAVGSRTVSVVRNSRRRPLYFTQRYSRSNVLTYRIPVTPGQLYSVSVFHAESHFKAAGRRVFNIRINGLIVAADVDVYGAVGANRELVQTFRDISPANGAIVVRFERVTGDVFINAMMISGEGARIAIAGLENGRCEPARITVLQSLPSVQQQKLPMRRKNMPRLTAPVDGVASPKGICDTAHFVTGRTIDAFNMNAAGAAVPDAGFGAENQNYIVGNRGYTASSGAFVKSTAGRGKLYETYRYTQGNALKYRIPVKRGRRYKVRIYFAETQAVASGQRVFDVRINGALVHQALDVYERVGSRQELVMDFDNFPEKNGVINVAFFKRVFFPFVNAISILGLGANEKAVAGLESGLCKPPPQPKGGRCAVATTNLNGRWPDLFEMNVGGGAIEELGIGGDNQNYLSGGKTIVSDYIEDVHVFDGSNLFYHRQRIAVSGNMVYRIPVPQDSSFTVKTYHAESEFKNRGNRVFDLMVNRAKRKSIDLVKLAGPNTGFMFTFQNVVPDRGFIVITLVRKKSNPVLAAISISGIGADTLAIGGAEDGVC